MKLAIISDTHDNFGLVQKAIGLIREADVAAVIHCGDITAPETVECFEGLPAHFVFGNCDFDQSALRQTIEQIGASCNDLVGKMELAGKRIAWTHGHVSRILHDLGDDGTWDYVFHGHTHIIRDERLGRTRVINPGALLRANRKTFALLDLSTDILKTVDL